MTEKNLGFDLKKLGQTRKGGLVPDELDRSDYEKMMLLKKKRALGDEQKGNKMFSAKIKEDVATQIHQDALQEDEDRKNK